MIKRVKVAKMDFKYIKACGALSIFSVLVGCGGGGGGHKDNYRDTSLNTTELAQVAAAIQSSKTTFHTVTYDSLNFISKSIETGNINKTLPCGSGAYRVTPNLKTPYAKDGLVLNTDCVTNNNHWNGAVELECLDAKCDKSITTATSASWGDRQRRVDLTINGEMLSDLLTDGFKGYASVGIAGKRTDFDFTKTGLVQKYYNNGLIDGFGELEIRYGQNNRCIDGKYSYDITSDLVLESNSDRVISGKMKIFDYKNREVGTVQFERDGGISVQNTLNEKNYFSAAQFESYCGLAEAYRFSEY